MSRSLTDAERRALRKAFRMPKPQTMVSRKSTITNAFVNSLIPSLKPSPEEIAEALEILGMTADDVRCAYCGDKSTEWDHLRPLVIRQRPTGYISEIGNLVPSCAKCNQSKRNDPWHQWIQSTAQHAPATRQITDLPTRIERLKAYEARWKIEPVPFEDIVGCDAFAEYWVRLDKANAYMRECQEFANALRDKIAKAHGATGPTPSVADEEE